MLLFCYNELMNIETIITLILAIFGTSGVASGITAGALRILEYRKARRGETWEAKLDVKLAPIIEEGRDAKRERSEMKDELREIRLDTTRTQLIMLMEHQPHNHDTIVKVAERYFCELMGDWYLTSLFRDWAKRENISIPENISTATKNHD